MATQTLADRQLLGFDLETTSADPRTARIVTAAIVPAGGQALTWLADPGVPIPAEATAIHGITTARARAEGAPAREVAWEVRWALERLWSEGGVVVAYNASYDLTLLAAELRRHGLPPLPLGPVLDPLVLWRHAERYRRGKKTLGDAVERFGITLTDAHSALADAQAAVEVTRALDALVGWSAWTPDEAMRRQAAWHREWATHFAEWFTSVGGDASGVDPVWPMGEARSRAA